MSLKSRLSLSSHEKKSDIENVDYSLVVIIFMLLTFGLVMVFSASSANAHYVHGDATYFFKRQLVWAVFGVVVMWIVSRFHYKKLERYANLIFTITVVMLLLVPIIGIEAKGAKRWLGVGSLTFQPSEFVKISLTMFLAKSLVNNPQRISKLSDGYIRYMAIIVVTAGLVLIQPHMSGAMVIALTGCIVLFAAGFKIKYFVVSLMGALPLVYTLIVTSEYRSKRLTSFLDPFADKLGESWQIVQSLYAIASGGFYGMGLGQSRQKFLYIPEPQNDFIFAVICEELGLLGAIFVMFLFGLLIFKGIMIARNAPDEFSALTATGITSLIAVQVLMNIAVVTSSMPVTGVTLPFFSYGGSSLVILLMGMGILLNISRYSNK